MAALSTTTLLTNRTRMTLVPRAVLENKTQVSYELKKSQSRLFHELPSGLKMEVIFQKGRIDIDEKSQNPPLVFVHGSFHAAWCWAEHFLPFFSQNGYDCYALSLLGQVLSTLLLSFYGRSISYQQNHLIKIELFC